MRGDDVYDAAAGLGKVVDVDGSGRHQLYPALIPPRHGVTRSPSQHAAGYYAGPAGCPHGPACPVHHPITDPAGAVWDGGHECCAARRLEHVYEIAAGGGAFATRCRGAGSIADETSYLPPGQTQADIITATDQLFDAGRV